MSSKFIISLDFELMWGVRDHRNLADYGDAVLGAREAIPHILELFKEFEIRATWATVGLLFAEKREDILDRIPTSEPSYQNKNLSPYNFIREGLGRNEKEDPYHYGKSLLDQISGVEGQEIGTHTFSHFYCLEAGQNIHAFSADLESACDLAGEAGYDITSIVFPRNQMSQAHIDVCVSHGIVNYRGNPTSYAYRPRSGKDNSYVIRGLRLVDSIVPVSGRLDFSDCDKQEGGGVNVPASRFLRPWMKKYSFYSKLQLKNIEREMLQAAKDQRHYHLWWHPHNMGRNIEANIDQLRQILSTYKTLRDQYGMASQNMNDAGIR